LTLWQCDAKVISAFLIFAVLVLQLMTVVLTHFFKLLSFFTLIDIHVAVLKQ